MKYIEKTNKLIRDYFKILSPEYPEWLNDYIETEKMLQQQYVNVSCGKIYSKLFDYENYTSLDHSIAVALIIWNFTHDKKQTISGLLHDISSPAFKHCIDFLNGDYMNQESTEELTKIFIRESKDIMKLLERDNITLEEVCDYHMYPIADNDTPMLSADRLEYSLSNDFFVFKSNTLEEIKEIYNDIEVQTNEDGITELGFKTKKIARKFVKNTSKLSILYRDDPTRFYMQAIADILRKVSLDGLITKKDLYELKETEVIDIIKRSKYADVFESLINITKVNSSKEEPKNIYYVKHGAKVRYIDPLYNGKRISKECKIAKKMIEDNLAYNMDDYVFVDESFNILKDGKDKLRIASFNISGGFYIGNENNEYLDRESASTIDNRLQNQIIDIINNEDIDIICFQEIITTEEVKYLETIANKTKLKYYDYYELSPNHLVKNTNSGLAIFSKYPINCIKRGLFPNPKLSKTTTSGNTYYTFDKGYMFCKVKYNDKEISLLIHHGFPYRRFNSTPEDNFEVFNVWDEIIKKYNPDIITGDFNADDFLALMPNTRNIYKRTINDITTVDGKKFDDILIYKDVNYSKKTIKLLSDHFIIIDNIEI